MSGGNSGGNRGGSPNTGKLILILMGVVPLVVLIAVAVAYFLTRAGAGVLFGMGIPFVVATIFVVGLSLALGRAASGSGNPPDGSSDDHESGGGRSRGRDGV